MKNKNATHGLRIMQTVLVFGLLLHAQKLNACWTTLPNVCAEYFAYGGCSGENPTFLDAYITGASYYDVCADAGNHTSGTSQTCNQLGPTIPCTYTIHVDLCDGTSTDTPESIPVNTPNMGSPCS